MFQEFSTQDTCLFDSFIFYLGLYIYAFFFKISCFFQAIAVFPVITMQRFDFKNSIVTTKLFPVFNLKMIFK